MDAPTKLMTSDEFWEFLETADPKFGYELVQGVLRTMSLSSSPINSSIAAHIIFIIKLHLRDMGLDGYVTGADGGFEILPGTVRIPDVAYLSKTTAPQLALRMQVAPDFVVEVISPSERHAAIREKLQDYLDAGVRLVWHVYPESETVDICRRNVDGDQVVQTYSHDKVINTAPVLPDLHVHVAELFVT